MATANNRGATGPRGINFINVKIKDFHLYVIYSSNYLKRMHFPLMISPGVKSRAPLLCSLSFTH